MLNSWLWIALVVMASAMALYVVITWISIILVTLLPARRSPQTHPKRFPNGVPKRPTEPVELVCDDGVRIDACFMPSAGGGRDGRSAGIVMLHGISDCKERLLRLAVELSDMGHNCLLLDFRGHGRSGGRICTYGYRERREVRAAVDWLLHRCPGPVGVYGLSLGGAVALLAADADSRIAAVVAEGPYARLRQIIGDYAARRGGPRWIQPPALYWIQKIGRFRIDACDPLDAARRLRIPVLLIHGLADQHVRPDYSRQLASQLDGQCELWLVDKGVHSRCRDVAGRQYSLRIGTFFDRWLKDPPAPGPAGAGGEQPAVQAAP